MTIRAFAVALAAAPLLAGCAVHSSPEALARSIERAHGAEAWYAADAYAADITVDFGGTRIIDGTMTTTPDAARARLDLRDGTTVVFDGERCWVAPAETEMPPGARFHVLTWPYFLAAPFKLRDPGSSLADAGVLPIDDSRSRDAVKLTFGANVGDAPDDWYYVFADPPTNRLEALAYIVTYGRDAAGAEERPSIVLYDDFRRTPNNVRLSHTWTFYPWSRTTGRADDTKGVAHVANVRPVAISSSTFARPPGAREDALPSP